MADNNKGLDPAVADLVRALAALLDEVNLTEIEYGDGSRRVRVTRASTVIHAAATSAVTPASSLAHTPLMPEPTGAVKAPMVGTVYLAPQPDAAPFIRVGDRVSEGQTLLIVEAMKVMNNIAAPRAGRVAAILVTDGMPVEYDQPLLVLD